MKFKFAQAVLIAAALLFISGCSTLSFASRESSILSVVDLINHGDPALLAELSSPPFVLDGEILMSEASVSEFWKGFRASGYRLTGVNITIFGTAGTETYRKFSESGEMELFFRRYINGRAVAAEISSAEGRFYLLLGEKRGDYPKILGIKGPVK